MMGIYFIYSEQKFKHFILSLPANGCSSAIYLIPLCLILSAVSRNYSCLMSLNKYVTDRRLSQLPFGCH